jgi:hypothetical protein
MQRPLTEILVFVAASVVMTIGTAVVGATLAPSPTMEPASPVVMDVSCLDQRFVPVRGSVVGALARFCVGEGAVRTRIELTGLTSGASFTAWLVDAERPSSARRDECIVDDVYPDAARALPRQIGGAVVDQTGRVELTGTVQGLRFAGGSEIQLLVIDHGWMSTARRAALAEELLTWDWSWIRTPATTIGSGRTGGYMVGCAVFRPRGGVESLERDGADRTTPGTG